MPKRKRKTYKRRKNESDGTKALRKVRNLEKKQGKPELHYKDTIVEDNTIPHLTTAVAAWLNNVPLSTTNSGATTRQGKDISATRLDMKVAIHNNSANTVKADVVRIVIGLDNRGQGNTAPTYADLYETDTADSEYLQHRNLDNVGQLRIIAEKYAIVAPYGPETRIVEFHIDLKNMIMSYIDGDTALAYEDVTKNALFIMILGNVSTNPGTYDYAARLRFHP